MIAALPEPRAQEALAVYNVAAARSVAGAQRRAAQLAIAFIGSYAPVVNPSIDRALEGIVVTRDAPVTRSPILRLWRDLDEGVERGLAITAASSYARSLSSGDLQVAQRGGLREGARATGRKNVRWRKELSGDACEWCRAVGGDRTYASPDDVPFHANDACSVSPAFEGR
jgi:hypothetical protein